MALSWQEVVQSRDFRKLSVEEKEQAGNQYFQQVVMPKLQTKNPYVLANAYTQFQQEALRPTLTPPPNPLFESFGNKLAEQASFGIANTEEGDSLIGNVAGALAGAGANALTGAGIGSVIPGIGTGIGATAGLVLGGFGQSLRETQNAGKTFADLGAGDYARAIIEGGVNAIPVAGVGSKAVTKLATGALIDAGINAGASVAGQAVQKGEVDLAEVAQQAGFGAGGHVAGSIINNVVSKRLARQEAQAQAEQALQGVDASQVGVLPQDGTPNVRTDLTDVFPYQEDAPFDVQGFNQDRTAQIQADLQAKVQEAVALKAQGGHNQAKLIRTSLSKEMNTLAKNGDPLASTYAQALDEIDNQAKALKQKKNAPLDEAPLVPEESFDPNTTQIGETRIDPTTGETVYYGGEITNALDAPDPFLIEELQRREQTNALEPIGTPVKPKLLKGDMNNVTLDDISSVVKEQMVAGSNVAEGYATDVLKSLGFKVDRLKYNAKGAESRAGINHRVKIGGKTVLFKGQDTFTDIANRFSREHKIDVYNSVAKRIKKQGDLDLLNEWAMTNDNDLDPRYAEGQGQAGGAIQALQQKLSNNELAEMDFTQNKEFAIQEAKVQELLNDLDKAHTPQQVAEIESRYQEVLNTSIEPQYIQDFVAPKLEETQALVEGFQPLNRAKQERLKARLERDLNQAQTPEDIARVAEELYSDNTAKALVDESSFYDSLVSKMQEAETRVNDLNRAVIGIPITENTELQNRSTEQASPSQNINGIYKNLYHGTAHNFDIFENKNPEKVKSGFFFTNRKDIAESFTFDKETEKPTASSRVIEVDLIMKNPIVVDVKGRGWKQAFGENEQTIEASTRISDTLQKKSKSWLQKDIQIKEIINDFGEKVFGLHSKETMSWHEEKNIKTKKEASAFKARMIEDRELLRGFDLKKDLHTVENGVKTDFFVNRIKEEGVYDGIIFKNIDDKGALLNKKGELLDGINDVYVVFDNNQIVQKKAKTIEDALPPTKGGTEVANSGKGSPQARLDGKSQELGFKNIKHLMQGYRALGGDLTPAKVKKVLEAKPELQPVYDAMRKLTGSTDETGSPKYAEDIEFQQSLLEIARTPEKYLNYEDGTGRQQPLKQLIEKAPQDWNILDQVKKSPAYEFLSNTAKKRLELIDRLMRQHKTMDVEIATEGGMSGKGGATNAIDAKKRQNITPISWAIHNDQIALNAYNADGHFAKYYLDLDPRLVKDGKEASRFLSDPVESTAPEFVGTYPNVYRDAIPFLLEDVLNRNPREQGILTSQARDVLDTARAFKSKLNKEQQLQIKYGANIGDIKKIQHELMKLNAPESVKKLTDAILNKTGNKKKLTANDIIAIKKTLEKEPTLKALKGMCDLFKLSTANLE